MPSREQSLHALEKEWPPERSLAQSHRGRRSRRACGSLAAAILLLTGLLFPAHPSVAQTPGDLTPVVHVDNPPNTPAQQAKHYVILVSLDGFRYDYPTKYGAPHIAGMAATGASAPDGMLPSYPSLTFPNHLTLATGLYPEHHGIVANSFYDPSRDATYVYTQPRTNSDGSWYGGTPLWVLAEQQGMRSACLFWPGSEAEIQGKRPSYYLHYDDKLDDKTRVDQVIAWLKLPPAQRPHFITLYYSNVDHAGHAYGPDSDEVRAAVHHVDDMIGDLQAGLASLNLPVDLIVVADHGMVTLKGDPINLGEFAHLDGVHTDGSLIYAATDAEAARIYAEFKAHPDPRFSVYRRADVPAHLHYSTNPREGDPVIVPNGPYTFTTHPSMSRGSGTLHGGHGFDPSTMPEMKAIFFATGPDIKPGTKLAPFKNINLYPLIAHILELQAPIVDGSLSVLAPLLVGAHQDVVLLSVRIDKEGNPTTIRVLHGVDQATDDKAIASIRKAHFKPALKEGNPIETEVQIEVKIDRF